MQHIPVLLHEVLTYLDPKQGETVLDCTLNRAGHALEIAKKIGPQGTLIGLDLDRTALSEAQERFRKTDFENPRLFFIEENFRNLDQALHSVGVSRVNKILFDLGLSSHELEVSQRGFTFAKDEPLLMTFKSNPEDSLTAKVVVNEWEEETIADILFGFADERYARRIAKAIVEARKTKAIETTTDLVSIIASAVPMMYRKGKTHFATKTFQAIRMAVNDELNAATEGVKKAIEVLAPGGTLGVITFHSVEDRLIKQLFAQFVKDGIATGRVKKAIKPNRDEVNDNPRARSAKLRILDKSMYA